MPTDPKNDALDEQLKRAMKALEGQVPDRYFDDLADRVLARLEVPAMHSDVDDESNDTERVQKQAVAKVAAADRKDDSGLHDIRRLARDTKERMARRRPSTANPVVDDVTSSSSSLRAVALPDPRLSSPSLPTIPIVGNGSGATAAVSEPDASAESSRKSKSKITGTTAAATVTAAAPPASASTSAPMFSSVAQRKKSKAPIFVATTLVAAAAGVTGYVVLERNKDDGATTTAPARTTATPVSVGEQAPQSAAPTVTPIEGAAAGSSAAMIAADDPAPPPPASPSPDQTATGAAGGSPGEGDALRLDRSRNGKTDDDDGERSKDKDKRGSKERERERDNARDTKGGGATTSTKVDDKKPVEPPAKLGPADKQEHSLDDLLREAGVDPNAKPKNEAPKLEKKALNAADIRKAMSALNGKAQGCHAKFSVSGSVAVRLTVEPTGKVTRSITTGSFAGTPTGDCVAKVAGNATFPPWDGKVMTVNYSYFLSE